MAAQVPSMTHCLALVLLEAVSGTPTTQRNPKGLQPMELILPDKHHHMEKQDVLKSPDPGKAQPYHTCLWNLRCLSNLLQPLSGSHLNETLKTLSARKQGGYHLGDQRSAWSSRRMLSSPSALTCNSSETYSPMVSIQLFLISSDTERKRGPCIWTINTALQDLCS